MVVSFCIWLIFISGFSFLIFKTFEEEIKLTNSKLNTYLFTICSLTLNLFVFYFVLQENTVYIWDYKGYWEMSIIFSEKYFSEPWQALDMLFHSIKNDEYNYLPSFFLSPLLKLFGYDRPIYILSIINVFLIPGLYAFLVLINSLLKDLNKEINLLVIVVFLAFPAVLSPLLYGYVSAAGLVPMCFITLGFYKILKKDTSILLSLAIVFLLSLAIFLRRWLGIWCVSTFIVFVIVFVVNLKNTKPDKRYFIQLGKFVLVGILGFILVLLCFKNFFFRSLGNDYNDIYSAYSSGSLITDFLVAFKRIGLLLSVLLMLGILTAIIRKQTILLAVSLVHLLITIVVFSRVQTMGIHHNYVIIIDWLIIIVIGVVNIINWKPLVGKLFVLVIVSLTFIIPQLNGYSYSIWFANVNLRPNVNPNMDLITDLYYFLDDLTDKEKESLYIIASDVDFNNETLRNINFPKEFNALNGQLGTVHVDKRDGLPIDLITKSKFVVVSSEAKLHLGEENQWVVKKFNDWIYNGKFSDYYKTLKVFHNDVLGDVVVKERVKAFSLQDIDYILNSFKEKYSGYENLTSISEVNKKIVAREPGDHWSAINVKGDSISETEIVIYPGSGERYTGFVYNIDTISRSLSFKAVQYNKEQILNDCGENGGGVELKILQENQIIIDTIITRQKDLTLEVKNIKSAQLKFEVYSMESDLCDWFKIKEIKEF